MLPIHTKHPTRRPSEIPIGMKVRASRLAYIAATRALPGASLRGLVAAEEKQEIGIPAGVHEHHRHH